MTATSRNALTDAESARIRELHAQGESCAAIGDAIGRNKSTVSRHCRKLGLSFDRAPTSAATEAKQADNKARRASHVTALLEDFERLRERAWEPYTVVVSGIDGAEKVRLNLPPAQETAAFYRAMGLCVDKVIAMERHDSDDSKGMSAVDEWLRGMLSGG